MTAEFQCSNFDYLLKPGRRSVPSRLIEPLTERELEVLRLVCDGASNLEIGTQLVMSVATVKWHLLHIFEKLSVERRTQAVVVAIYLKIITPAWLQTLPRTVN